MEIASRKTNGGESSLADRMTVLADASTRPKDVGECQTSTDRSDRPLGDEGRRTNWHDAIAPAVRISKATRAQTPTSSIIHITRQSYVVGYILFPSATCQ